MRVKVYTCPLSVLEIKSQAKKKFSRLSVTTMLNMLTPQAYCKIFSLFLERNISPPTEMVDGTLRPIKENPAVLQEVLLEINEWNLVRMTG